MFNIFKEIQLGSQFPGMEKILKILQAKKTKNCHHVIPSWTDDI
jgi:hypothetical protein